MNKGVNCGMLPTSLYTIYLPRSHGHCSSVVYMLKLYVIVWRVFMCYTPHALQECHLGSELKIDVIIR
jgi:hypothetical protein